jgi:hypothetical protein
MNEQEDIVGDQSLECEHFDREEIGPGQKFALRRESYFWGFKSQT